MQCRDAYKTCCSTSLPAFFIFEKPVSRRTKLELSYGTVINWSCTKNETQNQENSRPYDIIHANKKPRYLTKASIYKSINKGGSKVLSSWINSCTSTSPAIKQGCLQTRKSKQIRQYDTNSTLLFLLPPFLIINALRIKTLSYKITNIVAQTIQWLWFLPT